MNEAKHIPALDGLRGLAALLVVYSHLFGLGFLATYPPHSGTIGVLLFFVLSGFLMGHLYLDRPFDRGQVVRYFSARVSRILPLYFAVIILSFALSKLFGQQFFYYLTDRQFLRLMLLNGSPYVFWSIPPELGFYVVFAICWWLKATGRAIRYAPHLLAIAAIIFVCAPIIPGIVVFSKLHIFLAGVGAAVLRRRMAGQPIHPLAASAMQVASLALLALIVTGFLPLSPTASQLAWERDDTIYTSLPIALLFAAMLLAFTVETRFALAVFGNRPARKLGAYSFAIYLLHEPIIAAVTRGVGAIGGGQAIALAVALGAVLAIAAVTFRFYEMPAQRRLRAWIEGLPLGTRWQGRARLADRI